jgi:hypothetical protein
LIDVDKLAEAGCPVATHREDMHGAVLSRLASAQRPRCSQDADHSVVPELDDGLRRDRQRIPGSAEAFKELKDAVLALELAPRRKRPRSRPLDVLVEQFKYPGDISPTKRGIRLPAISPFVPMCGSSTAAALFHGHSPGPRDWIIALLVTPNRRRASPGVAPGE